MTTRLLGEGCRVAAVDREIGLLERAFPDGDDDLLRVTLRSSGWMTWTAAGHYREF